MAAISRHAAILIALGGVALLWSREAQASFAPSPLPPVTPDDTTTQDDWDGIFDPGFDEPYIAEDSDMSPIRAFLYAVRMAENLPADVERGLDFFTFYGGSRFNDLRDHPVATGEKKGVKLPDTYCRAAGFSPGCVSTAAGALQINLPTWKRVRTKGPYLPDFSPANQLEAGRRLMVEKGADLSVFAGRVDEAFYRMAPIWASLPRSTSQQPQKTIDQMLAYYQTGLTLA